MARFSMAKNILRMDKKAMIETAKKCGKIKKKPWLFYFFDIAWCGLKYQTGYIEYWVFKFYEIPRSLRKTYYSRGNNNKIVRALNDPAYNKYFDSKILFNQTFAKYVHRDWLAVEGMTFEAFQDFCQKHDIVVAKPDRDTCGKGIQKFFVREHVDLRELYRTVTAGEYDLIEENIVQHPDISAIYPHSVNTLRFLMVMKDGQKHIIYCALRMGNRGDVVDNFDNGGVCAQVDLETGRVFTVAVDGENNVYTAHPYTNTPVTGAQMPFFRECVEMVNEAVEVVPQIRYVGWDVCVTEQGPQLIEGNRYPGSLTYPDFSEDKAGFLPKLKEILGEEWEKVGIKGL